MLINAVILCLLYSPGIPLLFFVASLLCLSTYALDKLMLLRVARQPPQFDETLSIMFLDMLPVGILIHCLWGIWMFSSGMWPRPVIFNLDKQFDKLEAEMFPCSAQPSVLDCATAGATCMWDNDECAINKASDEYMGYIAFQPMPRLFNGVTFVYSLCALLLLLRMLLLTIPVTRPLMDAVDWAVFGIAKRALAFASALLTKKNQVAPADAEEDSVKAAAPPGDALYTEALEGSFFGNASPDYDIGGCGMYGELLRYGDNMVSWNNVSPAHWQAF